MEIYCITMCLAIIYTVSSSFVLKLQHVRCMYVCISLSFPVSLFNPFHFLTLSVSLPLLYLTPHLQPFLGSSDSVNQVSGKIKLGKEVLATLEGHWVRFCLHSFDGCLLMSML